MKFKKPQGDPVKTLLIILIGGCLIILVDLFLLGGKDYIWPKREVMSAEKVSDIQNTHLKYMNEGALGEDIAINTERLGVAVLQNDRTSVTRADTYNADLIYPYEIVVSEREIAAEAKPMQVVLEPSLKDFIAQVLVSDLEPDLAQGFETELAVRVTQNRMPEIEGAGVVDDAQQNVLKALDEGVLVQHDLNYIEPSAELEVEPGPAVLIRPKKVALTSSEPEVHNTESVYQYDEPKGKAMIVIMIDDMGLTHRSREVEALSGPLTLAYLPYADNLPVKTARAKKNGHELMVHMPMEPINGKLDGGPAVLKVGQDDDEFLRVLKYGLSQFEGYKGVNNHMGSRLTQDVEAMRVVMAELKKRGLYFVDSKTIGTSVAADVAAEKGLSYAERDVFLDHEITPEFVKGALVKLERTAYRKGYAIAIGHPHRVTIEALKEWLPTLKDKGLTLVPASTVVKHAQEPLLMARDEAKNEGEDERIDVSLDDEGLAWEAMEATPDSVTVFPDAVIEP